MRRDAAYRPVGWIRIAAAGGPLEVSEEAARLLGVRPGAVDAAWLARSIPLPPGGAPGSPVNLTAACRRADGSPVTCRITVVPDPRGPRRPGALVLLDPVDEGTPAPASAALLARLLDGLPNPVFVKDEQHRWVVLNDAYCRFMGYPRHELLGKSDHDFFPRAEADVFWAKDDLVLSTGETVENEESFTDASGRRHFILTRKSLHVDGFGRRRLLGVITDITERKQVEDELRRSRDELDARVVERTAQLARANAALQDDVRELARAEEQVRQREELFRKLADSMPQIVWTGGADGGIGYINRRWVEYTGLPAEAIHAWTDPLHPEDRERALAAWTRAVSRGEAYEVEYRLRRHDGRYRWHLARALPVELAGERRWFGTATDIQDQKGYQEALKEEDRRKDEFLAHLGHELRNPLTPVRTAVYLLRRPETSPAEVARAVAIIDRQVTHMARLLDDLLDVARISHGKLLLRREAVDLVALVRELLDDRRDQLQALGLTAELRVAGDPIVLDADPARIAQAIGNLIDNAGKYTEPGGRVSVTASLAPDGREAVVAVRDTGAGMSPETLARLFVPFSQAAPTLVRSRGGLGLGLALARALVELHGGAIEARSEGEGRGSEFTIRLPRGPLAERAREPPPPPVLGGRRRILVIEDNEDAAAMLALALGHLGHDVVVASTGEDGLARARSHRPEIILADIGLPGALDGYDVARAVRRDPALARARLVAITGFGQVDDRRRALEAGFEHHLTKPLDMDAIVRIVGEG